MTVTDLPLLMFFECVNDSLYKYNHLHFCNSLAYYLNPYLFHSLYHIAPSSVITGYVHEQESTLIQTDLVAINSILDSCRIYLTLNLQDLGQPMFGPVARHL